MPHSLACACVLLIYKYHAKITPIREKNIDAYNSCVKFGGKKIMTLKEMKPTDMYLLLGTKYYRIPCKLENAPENKIRAHLIYTSTFMLLKENNKFDMDDLDYIRYYFDMQDPTKLIKNKTEEYCFANGLKAKMPSEEFNDYYYINKAIKEYMKCSRNFQNLKQAYEDFVRVIQGYIKFDDFIRRYLGDTFEYKRNFEIKQKTYDEVIDEIEAFSMNLSKREFRCSLIKFITEKGKPTLGTFVHEGKLEHAVIETFQPENEIALLINVYPHVHFIVQFTVVNNKINLIKLIDGVMSNYFNFKDIGVKIDTDRLTIDN